MRIYPSSADIYPDASMVVPTTIQSSMLHDNVSTQTSIISYIDVSVQALEPPPSPSQPQKMSMAPLDRAEDNNTLPIIPPSLSPLSWDLSVLHSSCSSPFSSLQHHSKCYNHYSHQPHHHYSHSRFNYNSFYSPHHYRS